MDAHPNRGKRQMLSRRALLGGFAAGAATAILAACGGSGNPPPTAAPTKGAAGAVPTAAATTGAGATSAPATVSASGSATAGQLPTINAADTKKYAGQTINLAVQKHTATDAIQQLSPDFEKQTGIKVNFEQIPQQELSQKQLTDLSTGTGTYDVIGWFLNPEYVDNKWIYPVDELRANASITDEKLLAMDGFFPPFLQTLTYNGKLYALPFYGESIMMYYNTDEFQKVGIAKPPDTVAELEDACKKIKAAGRMAGISLRGSQEGNAAIYPYLGWVYGYGGMWFDKDTHAIGLTKPETIEATEQWGHFLRDYGPSDVASYYWNEVQLSMQQGKAAIIMDATNFAPRLEDPAQSKIVGKVGYAILPQVMGPNGPRGPQWSQGRFGAPASAYGLGIPRSSKKWQAAWLFSQWATSPAVMLQTTQIGLRADPTRKSSLESPDFIKKYNYQEGEWARDLTKMFALGSPDYWPRIATGTELADALGLALSQVLTGKKSAKDALTEAQDRSVAIQKKAGLLK